MKHPQKMHTELQKLHLELMGEPLEIRPDVLDELDVIDILWDLRQQVKHRTTVLQRVTDAISEVSL